MSSRGRSTGRNRYRPQPRPQSAKRVLEKEQRGSLHADNAGANNNYRIPTAAGGSSTGVIAQFLLGLPVLRSNTLTITNRSAETNKVAALLNALNLCKERRKRI